MNKREEYEEEREHHEREREREERRREEEEREREQRHRKHHHKPTSIELWWFYGKGRSNMDAVITVPQTSIIGGPVERDVNGNIITFNPANITYTLDVPTFVSSANNPDGTATFKTVDPPVAGQTKVTVTDTVANISDTGLLTVVISGGSGGSAASISLVWGTPA